jgi:tetratricopeptide (TPR) repeat protein
MKLASRTLVLQLLGYAILAGTLSAQGTCSGASGEDTEAGWTAYRSGDMNAAGARFAAALALCPDDDYAKTGLGYVRLREGATEEAVGLWTSVVQAEPNDVDALTGLGLAAWRRGDIDEVRARFSRVLALVPDHATALDYMHRLSGATGGPSSDPADEAWARGDTERAAELYEQRLAANPDDDVAGLRVALVRAWSGRYAEALERLDTLIDKHPDDVDARLAHARIRAWSGDIPGAEREVSNVLSVQPDNADALAALAQFQSWGGDIEESLGTYDQLLSIAPQNGAAGRQRAQALAWASRFDASRAAYDSLLARDPDDVEARLGLARTMAYGEHFDSAIAEYDQVLARAPRETRAMVGKGRTLGWAGRLVDAEGVLAEAVRADPSSAEAWGTLAQLYRWEGRDPDAKDALETAQRLAPTDAGIRDQLRSVNLAMAPTALPTFVREGDSDGNRMLTTTLVADWHVTPRLDVEARGYYKELQQGIFQRTAEGVTVSGTYQMRPGWAFSAGIGGSGSDSPSTSALFEYQAGVRTPERYPFGGGLTLTSTGLNETAALAQLGARSTEVALAGRWTPAPGWRVDGTVGLGKIVGSEENGRRSASLSASRRLGDRFSLGASFRGFSFQKDLTEGYFDPDFYGIWEITSYWLYRPGPWTLLAELAPGLQKVRSDGNVGTSLRSNARVAYRIAPGREISLSFGYSSAGLVSFATGSSGYSYTAFILGSSWTF